MMSNMHEWSETYRADAIDRPVVISVFVRELQKVWWVLEQFRYLILVLWGEPPDADEQSQPSLHAFVARV